MLISRTTVKIALVVSVAFTIGCGGSDLSPEAKAILLTEEPEAVSGIVDFKSSLITGLNPGGEAVIVGRVGTGTDEPWDMTQATFLLRDLGLESEAHDHGGDDHANCKFCQAEKAKEMESMALVRVIDADGNVIKTDAKKLLGLKNDQVVVAQGQGVIDDDGAFVFDAAKVFIRK